MLCLCRTEVHIRHEHSCNGSRIDTVCLGFAKAQAFPVEVGVQRIDDVGVQTFVKQKSEDVVAVMSGSLKPPAFILSSGRAQRRMVCSSVSKPSALFGMVNTSARTSPSELRIKQSYLSLATSIPTQIMMVPPVCLFDAGSTGRFTLVTLFYINRLAVSN